MKTKTYQIAIFTDNNRRELKIKKQWKTEDRREKVNINDRCVWIAQFSDIRAAESKYKELHAFPRMYLEKIIRSKNPNWKSLLSGENYERNDTGHPSGNCPVSYSFLNRSVMISA